MFYLWLLRIKEFLLENRIIIVTNYCKIVTAAHSDGIFSSKRTSLIFMKIYIKQFIAVYNF